jgi:hypothetical protein
MEYRQTDDDFVLGRTTALLLASDLREAIAALSQQDTSSRGAHMGVDTVYCTPRQYAALKAAIQRRSYA